MYTKYLMLHFFVLGKKHVNRVKQDLMHEDYLKICKLITIVHGGSKRLIQARNNKHIKTFYRLLDSNIKKLGFKIKYDFYHSEKSSINIFPCTHFLANIKIINQVVELINMVIKSYKKISLLVQHLLQIKIMNACTEIYKILLPLII